MNVIFQLTYISLIAIVVWGESLNNFESFKKLWCPPEFCHKQSHIKNYFLMGPYSLILACGFTWKVIVR